MTIIWKARSIYSGINPLWWPPLGKIVSGVDIVHLGLMQRSKWPSLRGCQRWPRGVPL